MAGQTVTNRRKWLVIMQKTVVEASPVMKQKQHGVRLKTERVNKPPKFPQKYYDCCTD